MQASKQTSPLGCATLFVCALALAISCELTEDLTDVTISDQEVSATFTVNSDESTYSGELTLATADIKEIAEHKDRIKGGSVETIYIKIIEALDGNEATVANVFRGKIRISGETYPDDDDWSIINFSLLPDTEEKGRAIPLTDAQFERVTNLLFPEDGGINNVDIMLVAEADGIPNLRASITVVFDAVAEAL